jgi:PAS domain S-box-containing protein
MRATKILIVEDEAITAMEIESKLHSLRYEVTSIVKSGKQAIEKIKIDNPDIILINIRIKGDMDGAETAEMIRSQFGTPVVFLITYLDKERIVQARITMPFGYILKPIQEWDLKFTIEMAMYTAKIDKNRTQAEGAPTRKAEALMAKDESSNMTGIEGIARDISNQKHLELSLQENETLFSKYFQLGNIGMAVTSPDKGWIHVNKRMSEILGRSLEEIKATVWADLTHPEDLVEDVRQFEELLDGKINSYSMEKRYLHKNGNIIYTNLFVSCLRNEKGVVQHILTHVEDISERKKTELELEKYRYRLEEQVAERTKALEEANKMLKDEASDRKLMIKKLQEANIFAETANREKSEFLANMSHELRTPMQGVIGFTKLAITKIHSSSRLKLLDYLENIYSSSKRLLSLLNDLLDLSKLEAGKATYSFSEHDFSLLIQLVINELNAVIREKTIRINFNRPTTKILISVDKEKMMQVIRNLIVNAINFSDPESEIFLELKHLNGALHFSVVDKGIGIPPDELLTIFDKFIQSSFSKTGAGGTGLGLTICSEIVNLHNGKIWAENNEKHGASFHIILPYQRESAITHQL